MLLIPKARVACCIVVCGFSIEGRLVFFQKTTLPQQAPSFFFQKKLGQRGRATGVPLDTADNILARLYGVPVYTPDIHHNPILRNIFFRQVQESLGMNDEDFHTWLQSPSGFKASSFFYVKIDSPIKG